MTGRSLSLRGSYGSSQSSAKFPAIARKSSSKMLIPSLREKERVLPVICGYLGQRRVAMILLVALALLVFIWGSITVSKESTNSNAKESNDPSLDVHTVLKFKMSDYSPLHQHAGAASGSSEHPCNKFALPPPPPPVGRRLGPRHLSKDVNQVTRLDLILMKLILWSWSSFMKSLLYQLYLGTMT